MPSGAPDGPGSKNGAQQLEPDPSDPRARTFLIGGRSRGLLPPRQPCPGRSTAPTSLVDSVSARPQTLPRYARRIRPSMRRSTVELPAVRASRQQVPQELELRARTALSRGSPCRHWQGLGCPSADLVEPQRPRRPRPSGQPATSRHQTRGRRAGRNGHRGWSGPCKAICSRSSQILPERPLSVAVQGVMEKIRLLGDRGRLWRRLFPSDRSAAVDSQGVRRGAGVLDGPERLVNLDPSCLDRQGSAAANLACQLVMENPFCSHFRFSLPGTSWKL
jgi:hypothetical protein